MGKACSKHTSSTKLLPPSSRWPDPHNIPQVPYQNKIIKAFIFDVYDGDTMWVMIRYGKEYFKFKIRVLGVDTPEIKLPLQHPFRELEKEAAIKVRDAVSKIILNKECYIKLIKWDKYGGRIIGEIFIDGINECNTLTQYLLKKGYGKEYTGQKKLEWTRQELKKILKTND